MEDFDVSAERGIIAAFTFAEKDFMETEGNAEDNFQKSTCNIYTVYLAIGRSSCFISSVPVS